MSQKGSSLDKLVDEKINTDDTSHDYDFFISKLSELSQSRKNEDLTINDAKNNHNSNLRAMRELIRFAKKEIRIYTSDLSDEIYGDYDLIISTFIDWLKTDKERKLYILVRDNFDLTDRRFYSLYQKFKEQIIIRRINLKNAVNCRKNAVIIDNQAIKLKKIDNDEYDTEYVVINFGANQEAKRLSLLFDIHFNNNNNSYELKSKPVNNFKLIIDYMGREVDNIIKNKVKLINA
jgi:hypothetical protein